MNPRPHGFRAGPLPGIASVSPPRRLDPYHKPLIRFVPHAPLTTHVSVNPLAHAFKAPQHNKSPMMAIHCSRVNERTNPAAQPVAQPPGRNPFQTIS